MPKEQETKNGIDAGHVAKLTLVLVIFLSAVYFYMETQNFKQKYENEVIEKERYIQLFSTEEENKKNEIELRRKQQKDFGMCKDNVTSKKGEIKELESLLANEMNKTTELQDQIIEKNALIYSASEELETSKREVDELIYNIENLETFVKSNSELEKEQVDTIHKFCGDVRDGCIIDANAMGKKMISCIGFTWVDDSTTSNFADGQRIFDPETFWLSKQGDCDDFSLYMASWLRSEYTDAKQECKESEIKVKVDTNKFVECPCEFYAIGGFATKQGGIYHMETGIGKAGDMDPNEIHIVEPQTGEYDGKGNGAVMSQVIWLITKNDFYFYDPFGEDISISGIKKRLSELG